MKIDPKQSLISIAMCSYNGIKYIEAQVDSILNQSHYNFELVICDDGSTDGTWETLSRLSESDNRINIYLNKTNLGYNKNFEKALSLCKGDYIAISDQDDIWMPQKLERLLDAIGENLVIGSNSLLIDANSKPLNRKMLTQNIPSKLSYKSFLLENPLTGHTALLKRDILELVFPIPEQGYYDWWIGFIAAHHEKFCFLNETLTYYRIHSDSAIQQEKNNSNKSKQQYRSSIIKKQLSIFLTYKNIDNQTINYITHLYNSLFTSKNIFFNTTLFTLIKKDFEALFPYKKKAFLTKQCFFILKYCYRMRSAKQNEQGCKLRDPKR